MEKETGRRRLLAAQTIRHKFPANYAASTPLLSQRQRTLRSGLVIEWGVVAIAVCVGPA